MVRNSDLRISFNVSFAVCRFSGVFIGDVANVLDSYSAPLVNYEYGILELKDYLRNEGVSDHQITKMWHYVQQLWARSYGKQVIVRFMS